MKRHLRLVSRAFSVLVALSILFFTMLPATPVLAAAIASTGNGGNWSSPATWKDGVVPTSGDAVTIKTGSPVTVDAANAACSTLTIGTGKGDVTLTFNSGSVLTVGSTLTIGNKKNDKGSINMAGGGTLNIGDGIIPKTLGTWTPGTGTVAYIAAGGQTVGTTFFTAYNNLTLSGSGAKTLAGATTVNGNLTIGVGTTLDVSTSNYNIIVKGNWTNNGTFTARSSAVTLGGLVAQAIGGSATTSFFNLTVNNVNGVTLNSSPTISGTLTLTSGKITTGANTLIIAAGGSISGGSSSSHVNGYLRKDFIIGSGQSFTFTIGGASAYTPVTLASMNVGSGGYLTVSVTSGDHPNIATSGIDSTMSVNRYWTLTSGGGFAATYNATFNYLNGDLDGSAIASGFFVRRDSSGAWSASTVSGMPTTTATTISGETGFGDFAIGNIILPPSISAVGLYQTDHATTVTAMSPQTEYAIRVTVSNPGTLAILNTMKVTIFYDADGVYAPGDVPSSGNTQTAAILTCTVGGTPSWSIDPGTNSTWSIVSGSCVQPTLTNTTGDFWFHFKAGKVATATIGSARWHIYTKATSASGTADNHQDNRTMNWYGEITVNNPSVNFGTISLGSDFSANSQTGIPVTYICNGNYSQQVKVSSPWTDGGNSVLLNAAGTPGPGEFSMKANDTATLASAVLVSTGYITIGVGTQTSESGNTMSTNTLWIKLGASGLPTVTYNGPIYYGIAQ